MARSAHTGCIVHVSTVCRSEDLGAGCIEGHNTTPISRPVEYDWGSAATILARDGYRTGRNTCSAHIEVHSDSFTRQGWIKIVTGNGCRGDVFHSMSFSIHAGQVVTVAIVRGSDDLGTDCVED